MRAFLSTPYRSCVGFKIFGRTAPITEAMLALLRFRGKLTPVMSVYDVPRTENCIWSPVIEGDAYRAAHLSRHGHEPSEDHMMRWCLHQLRHGGFDTHITTDGGTLSRSREYQGVQTGMDDEKDLARKLNFALYIDTDILYA